ncbi:hypothetical protein HD554DRAFT_2018052 [Boletus coccyginus]|nr:hypothetical protein HD554DRAFT_2018052 [Boletus coccyginus]
MHLVFGNSDYVNSEISDEQGHILYSVSTPRASKRITTITKYRWSGPNNVSETMATIEWHALKGTLIRFNGNEIQADAMLGKRRGRYFVGPDKRNYKWKLESTHCWLAESNVALARFHKKNFGIRKQSHPPYLDVSPAVRHMLDHVILTYVYVESLRRERLGHISDTTGT